MAGETAYKQNTGTQGRHIGKELRWAHKRQKIPLREGEYKDYNNGPK